VPTQPLEDLATRLERERLDADRRYNEALTALDRALAARAARAAAAEGEPHRPAMAALPATLDTSRLPELNRGWDVLPEGAPPLDRSLKGRLRTLVWRIVGPPLETQKQFNALVVDYINRDAAAAQQAIDALRSVIATLAAERAAIAEFQSLLVQYLQTITAYVDTRDRAALGGDIRERLGLAERRIQALKRDAERQASAGAEAPAYVQPGAGPEGPAYVRHERQDVFARPADSPTYVGFEDRFRGPVQEIRRRIEDYVALFGPATDVLDVGCGRGELLEALRDRGVRARGIDANGAMVEVCRANGLDVQQSDALGYLEAQADGSLGGLTAIQVVEHFEPAYLARFLDAAYHKLRPGSPIVLETINPACWMAFFETYIRDLTHQRPLHPDTLRFLVESSGFTAVDVQYRQPIGEGDRLPHVRILGDTGSSLPRNVAQIADAVNVHADRLNARLFSFADYAVIGRR
jgi:2-polyprenyl-3-methyl-5-hydroxy-6-metoxy-1,4-benzoquinol methylase